MQKAERLDRQICVCNVRHASSCHEPRFSPAALSKKERKKEVKGLTAPSS